MKKILYCLMFCLMASTCFADMPLWRYSDKDTGNERGLCYSEIPVDNPNWNYEQIPESKKKYYIDLWNAQQPKRISYEVLLTSINSKFTGTKAIQLAPYLGALQGYCNASNWAGIKTFALGLVHMEILTQDDYVLLNLAFQEQGIDLNDYEI